MSRSGSLWDERWFVVLAGAAAVGAWAGASRIGLLGGSAAVFAGAVLMGLIAAFVFRHPVAACLAVAGLAGILAQRSTEGLVAAVPVGPMRAEVVLYSDPAPLARGAVRADVGWGGRRYALVAFRSAAAALLPRLAGERILVHGVVSAPGPYEERMRHRHLAGRLRVDTVVGWRPGHGVTRAANGLRRTLASGTASLSLRQRPLFTGLVLGDDRGQSDQLTEAFRAAGLGHLLAVSGQNVAFVIGAATPLLMRLRFASRLLVTLLLLAGFALLTRAEPSVLRATAMAGIAAFGAAVGRPSSSLRVLALAVTGLLLVDPLLVGSLGFQLSVAGAAGIIVAAPIVERWLPGPGWLTRPLAMTTGAQLAVTPLLVATFGSVTLASVPANLLAGPAAGPVMVWGLSAGLVAGVVGEPGATLLHTPTRLLVSWIELVALGASRWPLARLGAGSLLVGGGLALVAWAIRRRPHRNCHTPSNHPAAAPSGFDGAAPG